jgi:hypothetical protein
MSVPVGSVSVMLPVGVPVRKPSNSDDAVAVAETLELAGAVRAVKAVFVRTSPAK